MSIGEEEGSKPRKPNMVTVNENKRIAGSMQEGEQLLPGIPDEITLAQVAIKLPWTAFHTLSSVSRVWQRAIQSHQVYDARIRSQSAQTLVAINHRLLDLNAIALFSMKDDSCYHLPPIPGLSLGVPRSCQCVSLDGKLYVLGGLQESTASLGLATADVYVLDLAGQRQWKQCASMADPRAEFGCGVIGGKVYVFGGTSQRRPVCRCEVYNPKVNAWSQIMPRNSFRFNQKVAAVGAELFLHSGNYYESDLFHRAENPVIDPADINDKEALRDHILSAYSAEVYHPIKNNWRNVEHFTEALEIVLTIEGNLYKMNRHGIKVYDMGAMSWKPFQKISLSTIGSRESCMVDPLIAVHVDEELLALGFWSNLRERNRTMSMGRCLMKSQGLGCENKELVWHKTQCPLSSVNPFSPFMCPIKL